MAKYQILHLLGIRPWERYARVAEASISALLDEERAERGTPPGRALDLGCGRGIYTPQLARRGWQAVGVDAVPRAIRDARHRSCGDTQYVVGDITNLQALNLGKFDHFLDVGCVQGLKAQQRRAVGRSVTASANPAATILMFTFGPTRFSRLIEGLSAEQIAAAYPDWQIIKTVAADTAGLGWPINRTSPQWYRLRLRDT